MHLLLTFVCAALATTVIARQASPVQWDKYADERGFAGNEDPIQQGHGGVHAHEADPEAIAAWEQAHGGRAPSYKPYGEEAHRCSARGDPLADEWASEYHSATASHKVKSNLHGEHKTADSWLPKPTQVARALQNAYGYCTSMANEAAEKAEYSAMEGAKHYARHERDMMTSSREPIYDEAFHGDEGRHRYPRSEPISTNNPMFIPDPKLPPEQRYDPDWQEHQLSARHAPAPTANVWFDNDDRSRLPARSQEDDRKFAEQRGDDDNNLLHARDARRPVEFGGMDGDPSVVKYRPHEVRDVKPKSGEPWPTHPYEAPKEPHGTRTKHDASPTPLPSKTGGSWFW